MPALFRKLALCLMSLVAVSMLVSTAQAQVRTIEELNTSLIDNGISWKAGRALYYPSFYTGFAPRVEDANRIHFHLARGNQVRLTAPLDEQAVLTYLFGLTKRDQVYASMMADKTIVPLMHKLVDSYRSLVASDAYHIASDINALQNGSSSRESFYEASLATLKALNPGRVFDIRIDLRATTLAWRDQSLRALAARAGNDPKSYLAKNPKEALVVANDLLFGRINVHYLTDSQLAKLAALVVQGAQAPVADDTFVDHAVNLLKDLTAGRYDFRTVVGGKFRTALSCSAPGQCDLVYPEFTAIYPNGSILASVSDRDGNRIPMIRENGVMRFVERAYHDVDHIRGEPFYGYIPKMDYTDSGNGIHNPAVRTYLKSSKYKGLREILNIEKTDDTLWIVSRGEVSHGCTRMASGHVEEVRNIFPSNPKEMTKLYYTGNASTDYDLFDINGDGQIEVMGVEYFIAYQLVSSTGDGYREANGLTSASFNRDNFYADLYGKNQFTLADGRYTFQNPYMSYFTGSAKDKRSKVFSRKMEGQFPLYEQAYEKDKIQFFDMPKYSPSSLTANGNNRTNKGVQIVRLMGRINGCGPFAKDFARCNEAGFEAEMNNLVK